MKRRIIVLCAAIVLIATGVVIAKASMQGWQGCSSHHWGHWGPAAYLGHELNLSDPQKQQIRSMWQTERPAISGLVQEFAAESRDMDRATANGNLDEHQVEEIAGRQGATLSKLLVEKEHFKAKIYTSVLNPEQRAKADQLESRWHEHLDQFGKGLESGVER
jgi:Spy/CpxP family protein refolding chaperone